MSLHDPWRHPRPQPAAHYVGLLADAPRRPLAIFGPRQVGKTHFLTHDLLDAAQGKAWEPIYVDLWGQSDPLAAVNTAVATVLRRLALATSRTAVTNVGALGISVGLAAPAPLPAVADPAAMLATQFAELVRMQPGKPVLLMLDEAQTLVKLGAGDLAMKAIRALFNSYPGSMLLVFTGS
ncbi:MAG TPA: AAA family ATPase, partial [Solimonas sp.]|nr:AAA family ATPase [Solimonas sp.]